MLLNFLHRTHESFCRRKKKKKDNKRSHSFRVSALLYYILAEQYYPIFFSLSFLFFFFVSERKRSRSCCCDYLLCAVCAKALGWKIVTNKKRLFYDCFKTCMLHAERSEIFFSFFFFQADRRRVRWKRKKFYRQIKAPVLAVAFISIEVHD